MGFDDRLDEMRRRQEKVRQAGLSPAEERAELEAISSDLSSRCGDCEIRDFDQPHPPRDPRLGAVSSPVNPPTADEGILAAICPPGWKRSPLDGRPVMPLVGRLLFPGDADGLPTLGDMQRQMGQLYDYTESMRPCWVSLIQAVIGDAMVTRRNGRDGLSQATEHALSECIDEVLRFRGEVRIRKTKFGEWEEVTNG